MVNRDGRPRTGAELRHQRRLATEAAGMASAEVLYRLDLVFLKDAVFRYWFGDLYGCVRSVSLPTGVESWQSNMD